MDLPPGWCRAWDTSGKAGRYYYYHKSNPASTRTWMKPLPLEEDSLDAAHVGAIKNNEAITNIFSKKSATSSSSGYRGMKNYWWDADSYLRRLNEARDDQSVNLIRQVLRELYIENRCLLAIPPTINVPWETATDISAIAADEELDGKTTVTFSNTTVIEACFVLASKNVRRVVCGLNSADGIRPGGGYDCGFEGIEEELCRRMPSFHASLEKARYPFGLHTPSAEEDYSSRQREVLYTPGLIVARASEDKGYAVLPPKRQVVASMVSAAPPLEDLRTAAPEELDAVRDVVRAIFLAPVSKEPRPSTLVISPWGLEDKTTNLKVIAELLGNAICEEKLNLSKYWREIHIAFPPRSGGKAGEDISAALAKDFLKELRRYGVVPTPLD